MALGVTSQLAGSIPSINMSGFTWGSGDNALLLGTNVIGSIVAWGLMAITLLENPFGSQLSQVRPSKCCQVRCKPEVFASSEHIKELTIKHRAVRLR